MNSESNSISEAMIVRTSAVLFAIASMPIVAPALIVILFNGVGWTGIITLAALLISPACWTVGQVAASRMRLPLEGAQWLSAASVGVAFVLQWAIAWERSGHDGMSTGYELQFLSLFTALMALVYFLIWKHRIRLGIKWAF